MKKIKNEEKIKKTIYSVSALMLCAVTLFSFWYSNKDNNTIPPENSDTTVSTTESTTKDVQVNTPVTNVPDDRYSTTTETEKPKSVFYSYPIGNKISREYSKGELVKNRTTDDWRTHNGVDINASAGDRVNAVADGTVTLVVHDDLWGTTVTIDHGNGITAKYCGLQKDGVAEPGTEVKANEQIGVLGEIPIENADGTHLHFEMYKDGVTVSPSDYLNKKVDI